MVSISNCTEVHDECAEYWEDCLICKLKFVESGANDGAGLCKFCRDRLGPIHANAVDNLAYELGVSEERLTEYYMGLHSDAG